MTALANIATHAAEKKLPFLLAGGHAVIAHGHSRNTFDIDLVIRRDDLDQWKALALELGYHLVHEGPVFAQFAPTSSTMAPLDLMAVNEQTFSNLAEEAVAAPGNSGGIRVVSLRHLLAMKCHSNKHSAMHRVVKDADDVIMLVMANGLRMDDPEIRDIFMKHGTAEFYEKVRKACRQ